MKNIYLILCLVMLNITCGSETKSDILSEKEFTQKFYEKIKSEFPGVDFEIKNDLEIQSKIGEINSSTYLENAYRDYKSKPSSILTIFDRYLHSLKDGLESLSETIEVTLDKVIPIIRDKSYIEDVEAQFGDVKQGIIYEEYNQQFLIVYVIDNPNSTVSLSQDDFSKFDIDYAELRKVAKENLFSIIGDQMGFNEKDGVYQLMAGGNFESSLILFPSLWTKENFDVKGDILISMPSRNKVLIFGSEDSKTREMMKMITKTSFKMSGHQLSNEFFKWNSETEIFEVEKY